MKDNQMSVAMDMVIKEFDKVAMCKRGTISSDCNDKLRKLSDDRNKIKEPLMTTKQRTAAIAKIRPKLLTTLVLKKSVDLAAHVNIKSTGDLFTYESKQEYQRLIKEATTHKEHAAYVKGYNRCMFLRSVCLQEDQARNAFLDDELKTIKMGFITGATDMRLFGEKLEEFEATTF